MDAAVFWEDRYRTTAPSARSWSEAVPAATLEALDLLQVSVDGGFFEVGGGSTTLIDALVARGMTDVTVLDLSETALDEAAFRLGEQSAVVTWVTGDICTFAPGRTYDVWHDRAVLHFFTEQADRATYAEQVRRLVAPDGVVLIEGFAPDGPTMCSGLPIVQASPEDLAGLLGPTFRVEVARTIDHVTPSGAVQRFTQLGARHLGLPR